MSKKIYFAGSIRGGRVDAALYQQIINHIKETDIVLTEHMAVLISTFWSTPREMLKSTSRTWFG